MRRQALRNNSLQLQFVVGPAARQSCCCRRGPGARSVATIQRAYCSLCRSTYWCIRGCQSSWFRGHRKTPREVAPMKTSAYYPSSCQLPPQPINFATTIVVCGSATIIALFWWLS
jgi:hypothetical protein